MWLPLMIRLLDKFIMLLLQCPIMQSVLERLLVIYANINFKNINIPSASRLHIQKGPRSHP